MSAPVRTFPIRLDPIDGEALDSWLDALSYRFSTVWADLLDAIGLTPQAGIRDSSWQLALTEQQAHAITTAAGLPDTQVTAMTLARYHSTGLQILQDATRADRAFPWGRTRFSRYCPHCLRDSGGRWQLFWRLGWSFACPKHRCLLLDECPACGQRQRENPTPRDLIAHPGHCMRPGPGLTGRAPDRCDCDLSAAPTLLFAPEHPVLAAQRTIRQIIDTGTPQLALYADRPVSAAHVLADIRAVAGRILAHRRHQDLQHVLDPDLYQAYLEVREVQHGAGATPCPTIKPGLSAPAHAATAATGVVAALHILTAESIDTAAQRLRWLISDGRGRGRAVNATTVTTWGRRTTATLTGIQLAALGPVLKPSDQLRYRLGAALPALPRRTSEQIASTAAQLPAALWTPWALRLCPPRTDFQNLATALSCAILLVGSQLSLNAAAAEMDRDANGHSLSHVLQRLQAEECWDDTRTAIVCLADYLHTHHTPINYQRRRDLDYSTLLTAHRWSKICRDTATAKGGDRKTDIVRCHLYAALTGDPVNRAPWFIDSNEFIAQLTRFPTQLTPQLAAALHQEGQQLLARHHISEPLTWHPPLSLIRRLQLPGTDPDALEVADLHRCARATTSLKQLAAHMSTTIETVLYVLTCQPAPVGALTYDQKRVRGLHAVELEKALPRNKLLELYVDRQLGFVDISAMYGVERKAVSRLAARYGIDARPGGRRRRHAEVDRDWLYTQYVVNGRTLPELAAETGMSTPNMARWAKIHQIPMRARGGRPRCLPATESHQNPHAAQNNIPRI
ncbi:TniQ family protein [Mycobacteroides abscessus]|uniref:TniQ family protein n=1 Tax=Mycobacteroides abscessus TaxID=36809 RepID=UPI0009C6825F|nr:TniQ family protein [Mycobacteroides abscessus]SKG49746.1 regulatory helix-turn-helix protein, lysR family [Mycobacteroides abscessus subsp. massiliense]SKH52962.1 regulatory helix-turn-helix protein, lysR family [Mycobacteroides abscessus subsp. massiliense]SKH96349.1 regulatory helix-turn-helix protein, lysR family [Mycobacteroides abscessus subsp. massiliense]SKI92815.1 regulatory helix-turn-helix protein, lysR family [Mycobacteroides abscessus subsp. massiliense]SKJ45565.1 regulatory he